MGEPVNARDVGSATVATLHAVASVPHNLPAQLSSFIGRERELTDITAELARTRILTLTGAGGCGKSRLAAQVASIALDESPDGVWWIELAALTDDHQVGLALAQALGVRPSAHQSGTDAAASYLANRTAVVVLDNCEHLLDETARVAEALASRCPAVTVLATSREPMRIDGETDWRVPSLSLPTREGDGAGSDAVRLFVDRARKVRPGFTIDSDTTGAVARICRGLDGIPLAIELAAARLRVLSAQQIADGLTDRFRILSGGSRSADTRHRTLRASVDWSHDLLTDRERTLFRRLGIFLGGCTLELAEQVCAGDGLDPDDVLDVITALVDKSLVQAEDRGTAVRYRLLETIRQYALAKLAAAGETDRLRDAHRDAYVDYAERLEPELYGHAQLEALDLLDTEAANFTQAIERAARTAPEKGIRLCVALTYWWRLRGMFQQAEACFATALDTAETQPSVHRARALQGRSWLLGMAGAVDQAMPIGQAAFAEAQQVGDQQTIARSLLAIGVATLLPDPVGSRTWFEQARDIATACGDQYCAALSTFSLGNSYNYANDLIRAKQHYDEVLRQAKATGNHEFLASGWSGTAYVCFVRGDLAACRAAGHRAVAAARAVGDVVWEAFAATTLAFADVAAGAAEIALKRLSDIRQRNLAVGSNSTMAMLETYTGWALTTAGRPDEARILLQALIDRDAYGDSTLLRWALFHLAEALRELGRAADAEVAARRALDLADQAGYPWLGACARILLGMLAVERGETNAAQRLFHEALTTTVDNDYGMSLAWSFEGLANVAAALGSHQEAARIFGVAARVRDESGMVGWKHQIAEVAETVQELRSALGEEAFGQAFTEGRAMTTEEAIAYVRRSRGVRNRPSSGWESLTPTELNVARFAGAGLTNPEIGARMFISRGTVKIHLSHIYAKLGIKNRAELATEVSRRTDQS